MKTEVQYLIDEGATPGQLAGELGIHPTIAQALHAFRPARQTVKRSFLNKLPEHLQRQTLAWNPLIIEDVNP